MTKAMTGSGWVYVVVALNWRINKIMGHHAVLVVQAAGDEQSVRAAAA